MKLGVEDSVVGGHESVDRVRTDRSGPVQLLLLLDGGRGRSEDIRVVAGHVYLVGWIFRPQLEEVKSDVSNITTR